MAEVAATIDIQVQTVDSIRTFLNLFKVNSLVDLGRFDAPREIFPENLGKLVALAGAEALSARAMLAKHIEGDSLPVHLNTLTNLIRNLPKPGSLCELVGL